MMPIISRWIAPYLIPILIAIALLGWALAATFKVQIEGLRLWPLHVVGWREENKGLRLDLDAIKAAQVTAAAKAVAAKFAEEERHRIDAERTDDAFKNQIDHFRSLADRYASANRVRPQAPRRAPSGTAAPTKDNSAEGANRPSATAVVLDRADFDVMVENSVRLKAAVEWAKTLNHD